MSVRAFLSVLILACFVLNTIPNQAYFNEDIVTNESVIIDNQIETSASRSEGYDLGIDSISIEADSPWSGDCSSDCLIVEASVPKDVSVTVTNYGSQPFVEVIVSLKIKTTGDGLVQYDNTFTSEAFPEGHPMHLSEDYPLDTGDSMIFTFNRTNAGYQKMFEDENYYSAPHTIFLLSGLSYIQANIIEDDSDSTNNHYREDVEVAKWVENGEDPWEEIGPSITFGDTDDNGADSYDDVNMHRSTDFDHDADGCGWARDCEDGEGTDNIPSALNGNSAIATFNSDGWYKSGASSDDCDWDEFGDADCRKFTTQPYQDDYFVSPPLNLVGMEDLTLSFAHRGILEDGDLLRIQGTKDEGASWYNLWNLTSDDSSWDWQTFELDEQKYEDLVDFYGRDYSDKIMFRFQAYSDGDEITECDNSPCSVFFIDNIILRGSEKVTRDVAVTDITVDSVFNVKSSNNHGREINATITNVGSESWTDLPIRFSLTNLQGEDMSSHLDGEEFNINYLSGYSKYGDITPGGGTEDQKELFSSFPLWANTYYLTVEILTPYGKDFFPENNSKTVEFRIFDFFFFDRTGGESRDDYDYTYVERLYVNEPNSWRLRDIDNNAYSHQYVWQYAKEVNYEKENPTTSSGSDDGLITQDVWDRDQGGSYFQPDVNLDLRAAYKPILSFAIKWDLADGDRLEIRAATDFDRHHKISSGNWTVLKIYENSCNCPFMSEDKATWQLEELNLEGFEGYQTWIEFRVVTTTGGGKGVMLDDLAVIGSEHRNNVMIESVDFGSQLSGYDNELSITVRGAGLEPQENLTVYAQIFDDFDMKVWPIDSDYFSFEISDSLSKGDFYTINEIYGSNLDEGIYHINVDVWRDDEYDVPDENPSNNIWEQSFELRYPPDEDGDGVVDSMDECPDTPSGDAVDDSGCSDSQKDNDNDGIGNSVDNCPDTPSGDAVDENGCTISEPGAEGPYLNAFPTGSGGSNSDYMMNVITNDGRAVITVEATELIVGTNYRIDWNIWSPIIPSGEAGWVMAADATSVASGSWEFSPDSASTSVEYFINDTTLYDLGQGGCYIFWATLHDIDAGVVIEEENWPFTQSPIQVLSFDSCGDSSSADTDGDGVLDSVDECDSPVGEEVDETGCKLEKPEEDSTDSGNTDTNTEQPDDSGPELESLEEETEVPSLGFVAAIFSIFAIAIFRRN
ncbi:MAG: hypothetical protein ACJZ2N_02005 [Candidatus Poseidoniales archaeon]